MASDAEIIEWWEERAAVMHFDGERSIKNAEKVAAIRAKKLFGRLPAVIAERVATWPTNAETF